MWASILVLLHATVALGFIARVLIRPRVEPSVRLAWIMVIEAVPLVGIIAYLLFGEVRMNRAEVQRMADIRDRLTGLKLPSRSLINDPPQHAVPVIAANSSVGGMSALGGNRITLLEESDGAIDDLIDAINGATDHVHVLFYIWLTDESGVKVADALVRAAQRGVECRVIMDALGSRAFIRSAHWRHMQDAGVDCVAAFPWGLPFISILFTRLDLRNHRKIVVIDNRIGFTGSRNCADMAFRVKARYAPWVDILVAVEGPVVRQLQSVFLGDWMSYTGRDMGEMMSSVDAVAEPGAIAQVVATGPDRRVGTIADSLTTLLHAARKSVVISTPYYVPNDALDDAIRAAARRGVDVTMILPERNDSLVVGATSEGFFFGLLAAGVRIRLFQSGLIHSKIMTVDGRMAMIGSANLDRRSFELNYEVNMSIFDEGFTHQLDQRQATYIERSREITLDEVRDWSVFRRLRNNLLALATPLL